MVEVCTKVMQRGPSRFDMAGLALPYNLFDTDESISPLLAQRLYQYAKAELDLHGFDVTDWRCEVSTMDADDAPADRFYSVKFTNSAGGAIGVEGILLLKGNSFLDHGLFIRCCDE